MISLLVVSASSCKDEKEGAPDPASQLEGTWNGKAGEVTVDGVDHSVDYADFSITFSTTSTGSKVYTVENGGNAFPNITVDTWDFTDNSFTKIVRGHDDVEMSCTIADNVLTLQFTIADPLDEGRTKGMFGDFVMKLKK